MAAGSSKTPPAERRPLSPMRRAIAATMSLSAQVPQFTLLRSASLAAVDRERGRLGGEGARVSVADFVVAAVAAALVEHPGVNASFDGDAIVLHGAIHVGIAIAIADGLVSPAIRDADRLGVAEIAAERRRLSEAVQGGGRLGGDELYGATFSISNLGPLGVESFRALVIPPQAGILAVGAAVGPPDARRVALSLSCDHRVVDGAPAADFLAVVVSALEDPAAGAKPPAPDR